MYKPYEDSIRRHLSKIKDIVAVCILGDEDNDSLIRVFSVVSEFDSKVYDRLLPLEQLIEVENPQVSFEFHVRVHQGNKYIFAVPFDSQPLFVR